LLRGAIPYAAVLLGLYWLKSGWATLLLYHAGMAAWLAASGFRPEKAVWGGWSKACFFAAGGLAAGPALILAWPLAKHPEAEMGALLSGIGLEGWPLAVFAVYYSTVHPLLEEAFWRFQPATPAGGWAGDALFAGYHLLVLRFFLKPAFLPLVFLVLICSGAAWRRIIRGGGKTEAVLSHAAGDAATMAAAIFLMG
jgi:hypothetical protein